MRTEADIPTRREASTAQPAKKSFWADVLSQKFSKPAVIAFVVIACLLLVFSMAGGDVVPSLLVVIGLIGVIIATGVIGYPKFGIVILFIAAYLLFIPTKLVNDVPLGTALDLLEYLLIIGFFVKQKHDRNWKIFRDPISIAILIWILYNVIQIANPASISSMAWLYTIRSTAIIILTYYVFVYQVRDVGFIKLLLKVWIVLALIAALDGFKQEFFGFFDFEKTWLYSDPLRVQLYFQGGHMRKFSIFSDPVAFAYNMAAAATLCIALLFGPYKTGKKILLGCLAAFFMFTMLSSGTRGAFPLVPAAVALLAILKFNKKVLVMVIISAVLFVGLIFVPTGNTTIQRFQSAFRPNDDPSYKLRKANQERIKPYIQHHLIGGGLGATGTWGERFAPNSFLAHFPPDSGYVRVAVELGSLGIIVLCAMIFVALATGINNYYIIRDPELKTICLGMVMVVFVYNIGNYPQEAIVQYPSNVIFFFCIAMIRVTFLLDKAKTKTSGRL